MKPFSLEEYFNNPFRKLITRDKRKARIICTNKKGNCPIVALIEDSLDNEIVSYYYKDGRTSHNSKNNLDIFFAPIKKEGWVNIYREPHVNITYTESYIFKTENEANEYACDKEYIATAKIEWEE